MSSMHVIKIHCHLYFRTLTLRFTVQVRISLDTSLCMVRERGAPRATGDWCRDGSVPAGRGDLVRFPYAVVEIKLQDEEECPAWVQVR